MENVYWPYIQSVCTIPLSKSTFPQFLLLSPHQVWVLTSSQAILLLVPLFLLHNLTLSLFNIFDTYLFYFSVLSLSSALLPFSLSVPVLSCPSGVWDIRQSCEANGLLINKYCGTRPQLTRTHTHTHKQTLLCLALFLRICTFYRSQC